MLNFFIGFAFFEFGALCGFFVAALMQAARDGDECAGRSRAENIQYCGVHHEADRPDGSDAGRTALQQYQSKLLADKSSGKQSVRMLLRQNRGVSSVEINKRVSAILSGTPKSTASTMPSARTVPKCRPGIWSFSKPRMWKRSMRFQRIFGILLSKTMRPSVLEKLHELVQAAAELPARCAARNRSVDCDHEKADKTACAVSAVYPAGTGGNEPW